MQMFLSSMLILFLFTTCVLANEKYTTRLKMNTLGTVRMTFNGNEVVVKIYDTPSGKDFLTMLPLTLDFKYFANAEKIAYLPQKINFADSPRANELPGDFTYYVPWGNLAVFYWGHGNNSDLVTLGIIESGKEKLSSRDFTARLEIIE